MRALDAATYEAWLSSWVRQAVEKRRAGLVDELLVDGRQGLQEGIELLTSLAEACLDLLGFPESPAVVAEVVVDAGTTL